MEETVDSNERYTGDLDLEFAASALGGEISLDPCAEKSNRAWARTFWTKKEDGRASSWRGFRTIFVNPPYGRKTLGEFVARGLESIRDTRCGDQAQLWLVPSRTATVWSQSLLSEASAVGEQLGRLDFLGPDYKPILNPKTGKRSSPNFDTRWILLMRGSASFKVKQLRFFEAACWGGFIQVLYTDAMLSEVLVGGGR